MIEENRNKLKKLTSFQKNKKNLNNNNNNSQQKYNPSTDSSLSNLKNNNNYYKKYEIMSKSPRNSLPEIYNINHTSSNISDIKNNQKKLGNEVKKIEYLYSPRTSFVLEKEEEDKLYQDLSIGFDPLSIKIMKLYFKEKLGMLNEIDFICVLKNHLKSWHPELPDREKILVKLLARLFQDIDLNCKGEIDWDDFTDYLMISSKNIASKNLNYELKMYKNSKNTIDDILYNELISYAFYIEKFNILGIVIENKSIINFYDANTFKRIKTKIDIKNTQKDIEKMELKDFEMKVREIQKKEDENKLKLFLQQEEKLRGSFISIKSRDGRKGKKVETPEKLKKELKKLNEDQDDEKIKKVINKKLTILTTCFVNDYDLLFVSSSNNKISAWKYTEGDFINVNQLEDNIREKTQFSCAIFNSYLPQYTIDWEPVQKILYSGQADGKILHWDINKSKNIEYFSLDYKKAKRRHDNKIYIKKNILSDDDINKNLSILKFNTKNNRSNFEKKDKQDLLFNMGEKMLMSIRNDMSRDSVSCIKVLGKMQILAAGYYNGSIILWDTLLHEYRKFYSDQNTGIYQIEYNINKNLIFTCGFDHNIYIYDPFINGNCIQKLKGHNWSVNSISCNIANDELISIDINGFIKIWDLINYYNFQSININEEIHLIKSSNTNSQIDPTKKFSSNQKMIFLSKANKILTYGEKLMIFGREASSNPELCDSQIILGCFYNPKLYLFYTVCLKKIKIWNIFNGKIHRINEEFLMNNASEISAYCTDRVINKLFIGNNLGQIFCINLNYGNIIKEFSSHNNEIINLCYSQNENLLISLSVDNLLKIHRDRYMNDNLVIKEYNLSQINITTINVSSEYSRLLIGTKEGDIKYFDTIHLKQDNSARNPKYENIFSNDAIISTYVFDEYPICLTCHESCKNIFEIIPPHPYKFNCFGEFMNSYKRLGEVVQSNIISFTIDNNNNTIFFGDMLGYVHSYSIKNIIEFFDENELINKSFNNINDFSNNNIKNKEKSSEPKLAKEVLDILDNLKIDYLYCFQSHREPVKNIIFIDLVPNIIIASGYDRRVKLFTLDGKYIDEFKQSNEKIKEVPTGIKYYLSDPFISKRNENEKQKTGEVYRKDIETFKRAKNREILDKMRKENKSIIEYSNKITEFNAQERLYILGKNCKLQKDRSTSWNYLPDLNLIIEKDKEILNKKIKDVKKNETNNDIFNSYESVYNEKYQSEFLRDLDDQKIQQFSDLLSGKIRRVKIAINKLKADSVKYKSYEKERKRINNINFKNEMKMVYGKNININKFGYTILKHINKEKDKVEEKEKEREKERENIYGHNKIKRYNSYNELFDGIKEDFKRSIIELENVMEQKLNRNFNFTLNKTNWKNENINSFSNRNMNNIKKKIKKLLPYINNSSIRKKKISIISPSKINRLNETNIIINKKKANIQNNNNMNS